MSKDQFSMGNKVSVKNVIQSSGVLLKQENVEILPNTTFAKYRLEHPVSDKLEDIREEIREKLRLIYWAVVGVHIELGYIMIFIDSFNKYMSVSDFYNAELSYMFFVHHYFMTFESIYRVWERFSRVLYFIHAKKSKKRCYYKNTVEEIKKSNEYPNYLIKELVSHEKQWEQIRDARNEFSHEYSKLTHGINYEVSVSPLVNEKGENFLLVEETRDHEFKIKQVKEQYNYLKQLDKTLQKFIKIKS